MTSPTPALRSLPPPGASPASFCLVGDGARIFWPRNKKLAAVAYIGYSINLLVWTLKLDEVGRKAVKLSSRFISLAGGGRCCCQLNQRPEAMGGNQPAMEAKVGKQWVQ